MARGCHIGRVVLQKSAIGAHDLRIVRPSIRRTTRISKGRRYPQVMLRHVPFPIRANGFDLSLIDKLVARRTAYAFQKKGTFVQLHLPCLDCPDSTTVLSKIFLSHLVRSTVR
ncbi:unnamed protein product [Cercospora beticola]|nr:unnamed protein product [Cercospora beticola]